jgi:hypothetical protein
MADRKRDDADEQRPRKCYNVRDAWEARGCFHTNQKELKKITKKRKKITKQPKIHFSNNAGRKSELFFYFLPILMVGENCF